IVGMYGLPGTRTGQMRDHLVGIHVRARARTGLKDIDRKLRIVAALSNLTSSLANGSGERGIELTEVLVGHGRGLLDEAESTNEGARHPQTAQSEILYGALGLCAPERIGRNSQLAHTVALDPDFLRHAGTSMSEHAAAQAERTR